MRWAFCVGALALAACTAERVSPRVDEGTLPVQVLDEAPVVFPEVPFVEAPVRLGRNPFEPRVAVSIVPTLVSDPPQTTALFDLREVRLTVDVLGINPSEFAVEFTSPEGQVFDRQAQVLTKTKYDRQQVAFSMPVAATHISAMQMTGTWNARLFHQGTLIATLPFEVTP